MHSMCIHASHTQTHTQNHFTALFPGPPGLAGARRELLNFMVQGNVEHTGITFSSFINHKLYTKKHNAETCTLLKLSIDSSLTDSVYRPLHLPPLDKPVTWRSTCSGTLQGRLTVADTPTIWLGATTKLMKEETQYLIKSGGCIASTSSGWSFLAASGGLQLRDIAPNIAPNYESLTYR